MKTAWPRIQIGNVLVNNPALGNAIYHIAGACLPLAKGCKDRTIDGPTRQCHIQAAIEILQQELTRMGPEDPDEDEDGPKGTKYSHNYRRPPGKKRARRYPPSQYLDHQWVEED